MPRKTCALRAPTALSARIKSIRAENAVLDNSKNVQGFYPRSRNNGGAIQVATYNARMQRTGQRSHSTASRAAGKYQTRICVCLFTAAAA